MVTKNPLLHRVMKIQNKSEIFHSSGYAQAQSGQSFGAASTESFSARQELDEKRKFVRNYNNARIINDAHAFDRVKSYIPRTGGGTAEGRIGGATQISRPEASRGPAPTRRAAPIKLH